MNEANDPGETSAAPAARRVPWLRVAVVLALLLAGLVARQATWKLTEPIRYTGDLRNAYRWGIRASGVGWVAVYDWVIENRASNYVLDYSPLRLLVMTVWAPWVWTG